MEGSAAAGGDPTRPPHLLYCAPDGSGVLIEPPIVRTNEEGIVGDVTRFRGVPPNFVQQILKNYGHLPNSSPGNPQSILPPTHSIPLPYIFNLIKMHFIHNKKKREKTNTQLRNRGNILATRSLLGG